MVCGQVKQKKEFQATTISTVRNTELTGAPGVIHSVCVIREAKLRYTWSSLIPLPRDSTGIDLLCIFSLYFNMCPSVHRSVHRSVSPVVLLIWAGTSRTGRFAHVSVVT